MSFVWQTTYSLDPYLLSYFWTWLLWGGILADLNSSLSSTISPFFLKAAICGFIVQRGCFWKHLTVTPAGKLSFLSKLASVIFYLISGQNWSFVWELSIGFQTHLQHHSWMILFGTKIQVLDVLNIKIVSVATFQNNMPLLQRSCLESQLGHFLSQDHLRGNVLLGP